MNREPRPFRELLEDEKTVRVDVSEMEDSRCALRDYAEERSDHLPGVTGGVEYRRRGSVLRRPGPRLPGRFTDRVEALLVLHRENPGGAGRLRPPEHHVANALHAL